MRRQPSVMDRQTLIQITMALADKLDAIRRRFVAGELDEAGADWELIQMGYSQIYRQDKLRSWKAGFNGERQ